MQSWNSYIFDDSVPFSEKVMKVFSYQYDHNAVYRRFCDALNGSPESVEKVDQIPLYPLQGFKETKVTTDFESEPELRFRSSGTEGMQRSVHCVKEASLYRESILEGIQTFYELDDMVVWAYTPGYNENPGSSLIWMLKTLIERDESGLSRFLPVGEPIEVSAVKEVQQAGKKVLLFGAAFGLMDYLDNHEPLRLPRGSIVMETGGMKTHKREISRQHMHKKLANGFGVDRLQVHSEYGMTEMLSQAYAQGGAWFTPVPWMQVKTKNPDNPGHTLKHYDEGLLGIIDLANVHSCSFLLTGDKGHTRKDGKFQVLGRWNPDNLRGCNFLVDYE